MSIQYTVLGFEPTTFGNESPPITTRPGAYPIKILQRKFYFTKFFRHSDWILNILNQSKSWKNCIA